MFLSWLAGCSMGHGSTGLVMAPGFVKAEAPADPADAARLLGGVGHRHRRERGSDGLPGCGQRNGQRLLSAKVRLTAGRTERICQRQAAWVDGGWWQPRGVHSGRRRRSGACPRDPPAARAPTWFKSTRTWQANCKLRSPAACTGRQRAAGAGQPAAAPAKCDWAGSPTLLTTIFCRAFSSCPALN